MPTPPGRLTHVEIQGDEGLVLRLEQGSFAVKGQKEKAHLIREAALHLPEKGPGWIVLRDTVKGATYPEKTWKWFAGFWKQQVEMHRKDARGFTLKKSKREVAVHLLHPKAQGLVPSFSGTGSKSPNVGVVYTLDRKKRDTDLNFRAERLIEEEDELLDELLEEEDIKLAKEKAATQNQGGGQQQVITVILLGQAKRPVSMSGDASSGSVKIGKDEVQLSPEGLGFSP